MSWYRGFRFESPGPRRATGGIKAQSKRGSFGQSWWAKRWVAVLEGFYVGGRLQRGRSYARGGQVLSIEITKGQVHSKVQGSQPQPYAVTIAVTQLSNADWQALAEQFNAKPVFAAKLLNGEMPDELETLFQERQLSLFPQRLDDLETSCNCPDYSNPCKHIAAVYYLLAEEFDRDPFLLFRLRGIERQELVKLLDVAPAAAEPALEAPPTWDPEPLPADPEVFWGPPPESTTQPLPVSAPPVHAALPKRLGNFPFWRGEEAFLEALEAQYRQASAEARRRREEDPTN